jgi:hypothetical protein
MLHQVGVLFDQSTRVSKSQAWHSTSFFTDLDNESKFFYMAGATSSFT